MNKYKYNGKEWQDEFGLNMYAMDMRQYDPAIARWVVQDPIVHHSQSPYNGYDGNPVFFADPSGGDVTQMMQDLWDATPNDGSAYTYAFSSTQETDEEESDYFASPEAEDVYGQGHVAGLGVRGWNQTDPNVTGGLKAIWTWGVDTNFSMPGMNLVDMGITLYAGKDILRPEVKDEEKKAYYLGMIIVAIVEPSPNGEAGLAKAGIKNLDDLIKAAGKFQKGKTKIAENVIKGDVDKVFATITKGAKKTKDGGFMLSDGRILSKHKSTTSLMQTISINIPGESRMRKIRFEP